MRRAHQGLQLGLMAAFVAAAPLARANGRFPQAQQLLQSPADAERLWLRATYGILSSSDGGRTWAWICEQSVGYGGQEDPQLAAYAEGTLVAGLFEGLSISRDGGCDFARAPELGTALVVDVTTDRAAPQRGLVLAIKDDSSEPHTGVLWETRDSGRAFAPVGSELPSELLPLTIDISPANPDVLYVSGFIPGATTPGELLRSDDAGQSWERFEVPGTGGSRPPFIAAVHPSDEDIVYVRVAGRNAAGDLDHRALVTTDGGATFQEILAGQAALLGFTLSGDGRTVYAGFGNPYTGQAIDAAVVGLHRASALDHQFERVFDDHIGCLTWTDELLYACGSQTSGFELAASSDDGESFAPLVTLDTLQGPLSCDPETSTALTCPANWQGTCQAIGACRPEPEPPPAMSDPGPKDDTGCGCVAAGSAGQVNAAWLVFVGILMSFGRTKRRWPARWRAIVSANRSS